MVGEAGVAGAAAGAVDGAAEVSKVPWDKVVLLDGCGTCGGCGELDASKGVCDSGRESFDRGGRGGIGIGTGAAAALVAATAVSGAAGVPVGGTAGAATGGATAGAATGGAALGVTGSGSCSAGKLSSRASDGWAVIAVSTGASDCGSASCGPSIATGPGGPGIAGGVMGCPPASGVGSAMRTGAGPWMADGVGADGGAAWVGADTFGGWLVCTAARLLCAIWEVPAMTATVVTMAAMVPAIAGVRRGVGRSLGPSAEIAANRAATMNSPMPTMVRVPESPPIPAKIARNPVQMTALTSNARDMIKARIGLPQTQYNQTKVPVSRSIHSIETAGFAMASGQLPNCRLVLQSTAARF